jgi:hypothetical protein
MKYIFCPIYILLLIVYTNVSYAAYPGQCVQLFYHVGDIGVTSADTTALKTSISVNQSLGIITLSPWSLYPKGTPYKYTDHRLLWFEASLGTWNVVASTDYQMFKSDEVQGVQVASWSQSSILAAKPGCCPDSNLDGTCGVCEECKKFNLGPAADDHCIIDH